VVVRDLDAIYADRVRPGVSVRNINNEGGPHGRSRSESLAADPPEQTPARMTARPGKIAVSARWRGQKRLAAW